MENNQLKIVYLIPGGLFNSGGMERVTTIKANYLSEKMGYDVSIVTTEQMEQPVFFPLSKKVHLHHLRIGIHSNFGKESYLKKIISRYFKIKQYKKALTQLLNEIKPDITISLLGLDIGFLNNIKDGSIKIGELHFPGNFRQLMGQKMYNNSLIPNYVEKVRTKELKEKSGKLTRLIVLTQEEKSSWKNCKNVEVIANPLAFLPEKTSSCTSKKAIAVGRLVYEKGFDQLIEVWRTIHEKYPDWELSIYGNGDQKEKLLNLIKQYNLERVIKIHDPSKDIQSQFIEHSIMLFPSRYLEALPMVLIEAMSCGIPIVAFDAPCGPKDVIRDGKNGFLVKSGDVETFTNKTLQLIESEDLRKFMGKSSRELSLNYSEDKIMQQWISLFQEVIKINNSVI